MILIVHACDDQWAIGQRLGQPDYSYYFVLQEFLPVLEGLGAVVRVRDPANEVDEMKRLFSQWWSRHKWVRRRERVVSLFRRARPGEGIGGSART